MDFESFFEKIGLAEVGRESFRQIHSRCADADFSQRFDRALAEYEKGDDEFAAYLEVFAEQEQLPVEVLNMYIYLRKCEYAWKQFREKGIDDAVFYDSANAFSVCGQFLLEREGIYGVSRSPHRKWMRHFFNIEIFRLGRLEFEVIQSAYDVEIDDHKISPGAPCISVHIPRGKLSDEACEEAYTQARAFFKKHYGMNTCFFFCTSWLLHPWLSEDLGPSSSIVNFQSKFKILALHEGPDSIRQMIQWAFLHPCKNINDYPEDTSLRRAAKRRLQENLPLGEATAVRL